MINQAKNFLEKRDVNYFYRVNKAKEYCPNFSTDISEPLILQAEKGEITWEQYNEKVRNKVNSILEKNDIALKPTKQELSDFFEELGGGMSVPDDDNLFKLVAKLIKGQRVE